MGEHRRVGGWGSIGGWGRKDLRGFPPTLPTLPTPPTPPTPRPKLPVSIKNFLPPLDTSKGNRAMMQKLSQWGVAKW